MRLTKLKLAGFKSFVDPTTLALPGKLIGVVGPNGCGKSNVMDAVRWVLGESKASELRGESMQDVIFNGSSSRKAVSRASVELIFENTQGRITGQWGQYAEIAVKRVLTRNGQSDYFINNQHVRRKDITDLFLGTGLGPRAYAIIGQGTISRIIEARPDELRVFLEEAAGVTKYKERRKETERRLADTRDNLLRIEDIRIELASQIEKLEEQAAVARQYRDFHADMLKKQHLLWLFKREEAKTEGDKIALAIAQAGADFEAETTAFRNIETQLEEARETHFAANETLQSAQQAQYAANFEVSSLEAEIRHRKNAKEEHETRLAQLEDDLAHWQSELLQFLEEKTRWETLEEATAFRVAEKEMQLGAWQERLPASEEHFLVTQEALQAVDRRVQDIEQKTRIEENNLRHHARSEDAFEERRARLADEAEALPIPDESEASAKEAALETLRFSIDDLEDRLGSLLETQKEKESQQREALLAVQSAQKKASETRAKRLALASLQKKVATEGKMGDWLADNQLENRRPLWQTLDVSPLWQNAIEAVLREKIGALKVASPDLRWEKNRPHKTITLIYPETDAEAVTTQYQATHPTLQDTALFKEVACSDPAFAALLQDWLTGVYAAPDFQTATLRQKHLKAGERIVTPEGDLFSKESVTLFAPEASEHGLLERAREIEFLAQQEEEETLLIDASQEKLHLIEEAISKAKADTEEARHQLEQKKGDAHRIEMEALRLVQARDRFLERKAQIESAIEQLLADKAKETEKSEEIQEKLSTYKEAREHLLEEREERRALLEKAERAYQDERAKLTALEKEHQQATFAHRESLTQKESVMRNQNLASAQITRLEEEKKRSSDLARAWVAEDLDEKLQAALSRRVASEAALLAARDAVEEIVQHIRTQEEARMRHEQALSPLRDKISDLRLKEQAALLNAEQFAAQLLEAEAEEEALKPLLAGAKPTVLQNTITGLQKAIATLGAVNLAALDELEAALQRKAFLDTQAEDLTEAMQTLENAIYRIDKETRDLLKGTFDEVNRNFGTLFPLLFGGGQAALNMTGEEILDAGVQVMAQPPGKKNATIALLSGGEKALTAIALVFAIFQLNPAPFCLLDEVDAPLDDTNTERFCRMVEKMAEQTQFLFISHNKIAMEMAEQLVGVTMQESGVSRIVEVDMSEALRLREQLL